MSLGERQARTLPSTWVPLGPLDCHHHTGSPVALAAPAPRPWPPAHISHPSPSPPPRSPSPSLATLQPRAPLATLQPRRSYRVSLPSYRGILITVLPSRHSARPRVGEALGKRPQQAATMASGAADPRPPIYCIGSSFCILSSTCLRTKQVTSLHSAMCAYGPCIPISGRVYAHM